MRLRIVWIGKTKDAHLRALCDTYRDRIVHFARCEITELRDSARANPQAGIEDESQRISNALREGVTVLLDREGTEYGSEELAAQVRRWNNNGTKEVKFIIGGPGGVSAAMAAKVDKLLYLCRCKFNIEMMRV